jgi:ferredoxin-thioredoxin reductase catalytic subunit
MKVIKNPEWTEEQVKAFEQKIKDNDGYCPCALMKTKDTKCMCKQFRDQIKAKELGLCHCQLHCLVES